MVAWLRFGCFWLFLVVIIIVLLSVVVAGGGGGRWCLWLWLWWSFPEDPILKKSISQKSFQ